MKEKKKMILARVQKEIQETAKKIEEYKELSKPIAPENAIGRVSRMDAINNKSVVEAALRESETLCAPKMLRSITSGLF